MLIESVFELFRSRTRGLAFERKLSEAPSILSNGLAPSFLGNGLTNIAVFSLILAERIRYVTVFDVTLAL